VVSNISKGTTIVVKHLTVLDVLRACRASPTKSRRAYRHVINQAPGFHHSNGGTIKKIIHFDRIFHYKLINQFLCECYGILGYNKFCSPRLECCCSLFEACRKGPGKLAHLWAPSVRCCADLRSFAKSETSQTKQHFFLGFWQWFSRADKSWDLHI
jgi:hypothetical protein